MCPTSSSDRRSKLDRLRATRLEQNKAKKQYESFTNKAAPDASIVQDDQDIFVSVEGSHADNVTTMNVIVIVPATVAIDRGITTTTTTELDRRPILSSADVDVRRRLRPRRDASATKRA